MAKKALDKNQAATAGHKTTATAPSRNVVLGGRHGRAEPTPARWTFLTNHSHVLILLTRNPSMVLRDVASLVGITERAVQRIIAELEEEGFIEREKVGRQNHYRILEGKTLRHPIESHCTVGDLLHAIDGENVSRK